MSDHKKQKNQNRASQMTLRHHLTVNEASVITFVFTILLASVAIIEGTKEPVVWAFLGTAIGASIGHIEKK